MSATSRPSRWAALLVLALGTTLDANVGVFSGAGTTVFLDRSEHIRLVSEDVTITLVPTSTPFFEAAFRCVFELRNLGDESHRVQVGFPLMVSAHGSRAPEPQAFDELGFVARSGATLHPLRYAASDGEERFRHVLLWTMEFGPRETQELVVSYRLPASVALSMTFREEDPTKTRVGGLYDLQIGAMVSIGYVTETGASWAGTIDRARFALRTRRFELSLSYSPYVASSGSGSLVETLRRTPCAWFRVVEPTAWGDPVATDEGIEWVHEPFQPGSSLGIGYHLTGWPTRPEGVREWCRDLAARGADLEVLRDVVLARSGVPASSRASRRFLENQWWYEPVAGRMLEDLSSSERRLIEVLDEVRLGIPEPTSLSPAARGASERIQRLAEALAQFIEWLLR